MTIEICNKTINVDPPQEELASMMELLRISEDEALSLWLCDNDYITDEEQEALDSKAKKIKIQLHAKADIRKKREQKPRTVKISDEKKHLFSCIRECLENNYTNVKIEKENKLFLITTDTGKVFKIDLIEQRPKK